jgi:hypothetical protein
LKVDVASADLQRIHSLIKTSTEVVSSFPDYHPHLTLAYLKKGMAKHYIGDTRFEGRQLTFNNLSFSPSEGSRTEISLVAMTPLPKTVVASIPDPATEVTMNLSGKKVTLSAINAEGQKVLIEMDANEAWQETQQRLTVYRDILRWLKED